MPKDAARVWQAGKKKKLSQCSVKLLRLSTDNCYSSLSTNFYLPRFENVATFKRHDIIRVQCCELEIAHYVLAEASPQKVC